MTERIDEAQGMEASDPRRIAASMAMFERLSEHWSLRREERETLLGGVPKSTWSEWRQRPALARLRADTRERIANLFTVDLNAHSLFAPEFADRWIREPNAAFHGASPIATMMRGKVEDIISVRRYLERVRTSSPADAPSSREATTEPVAVSALIDPFTETAKSDSVQAESGTLVPVFVQPDVYALLQAASRQTHREISSIIEDALAVRELADKASEEHRASKERGKDLVAQRRGEATLTTRERQIVNLVLAGRTAREIAETLVISDRTVETHVAKAFRKLGVTNRTELSTLGVETYATRLHSETADADA